MNPELPAAAAEFGATATRVFTAAALGGVDAARRAEAEPAERGAQVAGALRALGVDDLDPRADDEALAAAAALCEERERVALPYPLDAVRDRVDRGRPFAVVPEAGGRVDHGELFEEWRVSTLAGPATVAAPKGGALGSRLGPFVSDLAPVGDEGGSARAEVDLHLALTAWWLLGVGARAVELAVDHVSTRVQFGKPLSAFQAVQFQLADATVAVAGLRELAGFTLWRLSGAPGQARADVLALRVHALDVVRAVLRTSQQLHGAAGVCDEYDISVLTRHAQPALRLPWSAERTAAELAAAIAAEGFEGLFPHGRAPG